MIETGLLSNWIVARLNTSSILVGATGGNFDANQIPKSVPVSDGFCRVVFQSIPMNDKRATLGRRMLVPIQYKIFAVGVGDDYTPLQPLADELDRIFQQDQFTGDSLVAGVSRLRMYQFDEVRDDTRFNELGAFFYFEAYPQ